MTVPRNVAVIGGGITGAVVASELSKRSIPVVVFDQGRRGPGGRASHRSLFDKDSCNPLDKVRLVQGRDLEFDHGCQFFRADTPVMQSLVKEWVRLGWAGRWKAHWKRLGDAPKFFGLPDNDVSSVYVGVGGMHMISRELMDDSDNVQVVRGSRVRNVKMNAEGQWEIWHQTGQAAYHDTPEKEAHTPARQFQESFDAVVVTDASASQDTWHRASAGLPPDVVRQLPFLTRPRVPFFTCMVAIDEPIHEYLEAEAFVGDSPLWAAVYNESKPGLPKQGRTECWTLVSTPDFAVQQIQETPMRDPETGAFRPQEDSYLNQVPGRLLYEAFSKAIQPFLPDEAVATAPRYLQAQRWGSGLPAPSTDHCGDIVNVDGLEYVSQIKELVYPRPETDLKDFVACDEERLFYAGDFCSHRCPGFEAAALSGFDLAQHILQSK